MRGGFGRRGDVCSNRARAPAGLARLVLPLLVAGCADDATRPASWPPLAGAERARFATDAPAKVVRANACALTGAFRVGERERHWKVTVGDRRCWSPPDADSIPLYVYMRYVGDQATVVLEAAARDVPEETLRVAVASTGRSLKAAIGQTEKARAAEAKRKHGNGGAIAAAAQEVAR
jgi:hypothetical protein